ncbi:MAG: hypothetical protein LUH19_03635 [Lachnospiraceae bacterium]|nr:hypothetical protein [Lachnospiraceae bacterium]
MLYTKSAQKFDSKEFQTPEACYRGAPFWSWNCLITKEMIDEQIQYFKQMGMGGFHVHVRVGLKNQYMDEDFLELVRYCDEKAKENGMLCWLYDEDRYSSGTAGGEVTKNVKYRARKLRLSVQKKPELFETPEIFRQKQEKNIKSAGCLRAVYDIILKDGFLEQWRIIMPEEEARGVKWYLYEELDQETPWINNQTYVDTFNPEATECFICMTHEKYASVLGQEFGKSVPAIFTDEPNIKGMAFPNLAEEVSDITLPFTEALPRQYQKRSGRNFYEALPEVIWNRKGEEPSWSRYCFFDVCSEMFVKGYCAPIGDWCGEHRLYSTGHILGEESLKGQSQTVGEAMRCYREFQLPGIDNLCDHREFAAVKQAASVAHQYGKEGILSELYGVTQWDFPFRGYKKAGDWQAALGVTTRVPHLAWASMGGEAKRDYPAAIGWQSPWYENFSYIEDYFSRIYYCMTRGENVVYVGVIHPIETMWCLQGPADQMGGKRTQLEEDFQKLTEWLLTGGLDFDYISESLLEELGSNPAAGKFVCGKGTYDVILVPDCITLRENTWKRLKQFADCGGTVLFVGDVPRFVECRREEWTKEFVDRCRRLPMRKAELLEALQPWREIEVLGKDRSRKEIYLSRIRQEKENRWVFLAQAYEDERARGTGTWDARKLHSPEELVIRLKGEWSVERMNALTGEIEPWDSQVENGWTELWYSMYGDDSLLLRLSSVGEVQQDNLVIREEAPDVGEAGSFLREPEEYRTDEPNVLVLDHFLGVLDHDAVWEECELLKLDNRIREKLGYPLRMEAMEQPYINQEKDVRDHCVELRTVIHSEIELARVRLALEEPEYCTGTLNGERICMRPEGFYVDKAIQTVLLPPVHSGENELVLQVRYGKKSGLEWMYLLGEFGVEVRGSHCQLTAKPEKLYWGDYTAQGFPFYTGNMTYVVPWKEKLPEGNEAGGRWIQVPYYSGAAVKIRVNDDPEQMAAFLPFRCRLNGLKEGENRIEITCLGNRYNGFGQLHLMGNDEAWLGQNSWRTQGHSWTDTYQIRKMGILSAPIIYGGGRKTKESVH